MDTHVGLVTNWQKTNIAIFYRPHLEAQAGIAVLR